MQTHSLNKIIIKLLDPSSRLTRSEHGHQRYPLSFVLAFNLCLAFRALLGPARKWLRFVFAE